MNPVQAMKKLVWSETLAEGGKQFSGLLPRPPSTTGPFQDIALRGAFSLSAEGPSTPEYYSDAAVIAWRVPEKDVPLSALKPVVTSSGGKFSLEKLTDGDLSTSVLLPAARDGEKSWIQFDFGARVTMRALTIVGGGYGGTFGMGADPDNRALEAGNDSTTFTRASTIRAGGVGQRTLTFEPVTARYFRFTWTATPSAPFPAGIASTFGLRNRPAPPARVQVAELVLHQVPRINMFEEKAAFLTAGDLNASTTPQVDNADTINKNEVINLTPLLKPDGSLEWTSPEGTWIILRLGYSLTGHQNSPASPEATGL